MYQSRSTKSASAASRRVHLDKRVRGVMSLADIRNLLDKAVHLCTQLRELENIACRTSSHASQHQLSSEIHLQNSHSHAPSANDPNSLQPDHDQQITVLLKVFDDIVNGVTEFRIRRREKKGFDPLSKAAEPTPKPQIFCHFNVSILRRSRLLNIEPGY